MTGSRISVVTRERVAVRGRDLVDELIGQRDFVDMFLLQLLGADPSPVQRHLVNAVMVAIMEHGLVPSVIAARLTLYGAPESFQGAVASGLLGVGDRFAGTASECAKLLSEIVSHPAEGRLAAADAIVARHRAIRAPVPGFGHPNHKDGDVRYHKLIAVAREVGADGGYLDAATFLGEALVAATGKVIPPNISLAIGALLAEARLPEGSFRGVVLIARCAGLVGHLTEELEAPISERMWAAADAAAEAGD
jgi:citrate synthase